MLDDIINELLPEAEDKFMQEARAYEQKNERLKLSKKLKKVLVDKPFHEEVQEVFEKGCKLTGTLRDEIWAKYKPIMKIANAVYGNS